MRLTLKDLDILRLALANYAQEESEGATATQDDLDYLERLEQKILRERLLKTEKAGVQ